MAGTIPTDSEGRPHVERPVRKSKPTTALLHSEEPTLPFQQKAVKEFLAAEATKRATGRQLAIGAVQANQSMTSSSSRASSPKTASSAVAAVPTARTPSTSCIINTTKRAHDDEIIDEESGDEEQENACINPKPKKRRTVVLTDSEAVSNDGIPTDVDIQSVTDSGTTCEGKTADIDRFFSATFDHTGTNGKVKKHRKCKICLKHCVLVNEPTTLHRHAEANFAAKYRKWAKSTTFESMLPGDVKARKAKAESVQHTIDSHLTEHKLAERVLPYSDKIFTKAAIEWLIATDQPVQALEHPKIKEMIDITARATNGVKIPGRKATCTEIMRMFKNHLTKLKEILNSDAVSGAVNITCNGWQASNTDGYFAVTGHWIEENIPTVWECKSLLLGFTKVNNAHNGKCLGGALFKVLDHVNIAHKRLISTYSQSPHYAPHDPKAHEPDTSKTTDRDEIGLERSSAKQKELYKMVQVKAGVALLTQLLLDMKIRWSSTFVMVNCAESNKEHVNAFVYEMGLQERDLEKRAKIDYLRLTPAEWTRVGQFADLLSYADVAQQAFSSDAGTTLHLAIPALEALHKAWSSQSRRAKYTRFAPALDAAGQKIDEYYEKTTDSSAYIMTMLLNPMGKMAYFKKNWPEELQDDVLVCAEQVFEARYLEMGKSVSTLQPSIKKGKASGLRKLIRETQSSDKDEDSGPFTAAVATDPTRPWRVDFMNYLNTTEVKLPPEMTIIQWWGPGPSSLAEEEPDEFEVEVELGGHSDNDDVEEKGWDSLFWEEDDNNIESEETDET
ncbi:Ribonuclease H-like domain containing protein [Russula decolorans]